MSEPDGSSKTTHGAYAAEQRTKSVSKTIAECDAAMAKQLREWAERLEKAANETRSNATPQHDVLQIANDMKNHAFVVETFTTDLLERIAKESR